MSFGERPERKIRSQLGQQRVLGSSVIHGHTEESEQGWVWQPLGSRSDAFFERLLPPRSWRGWTASSRHSHEQRMRQQWQQEARERWHRANAA